MFATSSVSPINNLIKNLFELCIIVKEGVTSKSLLPWIYENNLLKDNIN